MVVTVFQTHEDAKRNHLDIGLELLPPLNETTLHLQKECLTVLWVLQKILPYLLYEKFIFFTDHTALNWLMNITGLSGCLTCWLLRLAEYGFQIKNKKGCDNTHDDSLSSILTSTTIEPKNLDDIHDLRSHFSSSIRYFLFQNSSQN